MEELHHTGTARIARLLMRPMSLWESGDSNGAISLNELFSNPNFIAAENCNNLQRIAYLICRGGWPQATMLDSDEEVALDQAIDYYDAVVNADIQRVDGVERNLFRYIVC